jgi:hypothetical protein
LGLTLRLILALYPIFCEVIRRASQSKTVELGIPPAASMVSHGAGGVLHRKLGCLF